jgi:hypothetical protein
MSNSSYLVVVSRDPADDAPETRRVFDLVLGLAKSGADIVVWLVHNGVFAARDALAERVLAPLVKVGVRVITDDFSIRERGIPSARLSPHTTAVPIDDIVGEIAAGRKPLWH